MARGSIKDKVMDCADRDHAHIQGYLGSKDWEETLRIARETREKVMADRARQPARPARIASDAPLRPNRPTPVDATPVAADFPIARLLRDMAPAPPEVVPAAQPTSAGPVRARLPNRRLMFALAGGVAIGLLIQPTVTMLRATTTAATPAAPPSAPIARPGAMPAPHGAQDDGISVGRPASRIEAPARRAVALDGSQDLRDKPAAVPLAPDAPPAVSVATRGLSAPGVDGGMTPSSGLSAPLALPMRVHSSPGLLVVPVPVRNDKPLAVMPPTGPVAALSHVSRAYQPQGQQAAPSPGFAPAPQPMTAAPPLQSGTTSADALPAVTRSSPLVGGARYRLKLHVPDIAIYTAILPRLTDMGLVNTELVPSRFATAQTIIAFYRAEDAGLAQRLALTQNGQIMDLSGLTPTPAAGTLDIYLADQPAPATAPD